MGHFWMRSPPGWWVYGFYAIGILSSMLLGVRKTQSRRSMLILLAGWSLLGLLYGPASDLVGQYVRRQPTCLAMTFIDVGHGTCVLIETPEGETWLYDAGRLGDHQRSYQVITDALWAMNKSIVDCAIISHADSDHYNAIEGIARRFRIRQILSTDLVFQHPSPLLKQNLAAAFERGSHAIAWNRGDHYDGKHWSMLAVHPPKQEIIGSDNAKSLCVLLEFAGRRILLPGDLEPPGTAMLTSMPNVDVDILMAPHHGSLGAKSDTMMQWCSPETVIISGSYRAWTPRVLGSFGEIRPLVTARDHAIRIAILENGKIEMLHWDIDAWTAFPDREL
jgi:competence protein ComEC